MKKRLLVCLLTLCLTIGMVSAFGFSASAAEATPVATVTSGETAVDVLTFADAVSAAVASKGSTVKLLADTEAAAMEIGGEFSVDLNGKALSLTGPLTLSTGKVTVCDSSEKQEGRILADKSSAIVMKGGSLLLTGGNLHSKTTYALQNCGTGEIFLAKAPSITSDAGVPLYVGYSNTLNGNDGDKTAYTGKQIRFAYGYAMVQDSVIAKNATAAQFAIEGLNPNLFVVEEKEGNLVAGKIALYAWGIIALLAVLSIVFVIMTIVRTVRYKRRMKFYSVSFPVLLATLAVFTKTQIIALIAAGAVCAVALIVLIVSSALQSKKLKATIEAKKAAAAEAKKAKAPVEAAVEEAPVEEVAEAVVEEAPVEEVAEAVVEEAPVEEAVEEVIEEAPAVAQPPKEKPDRVVIAETDANGNVIYSAYKKSFTARMIQSPAEVQERYETLKNALLSYKKVNSRVSWSYDSIKTGRKQLAKFAIRGKSLCLFLALDVNSLEGSKYNVADAGTSKKYAEVPCRLRLSSKRSIKWGLELIEKLAEQEELVANPKFTPKKWCMENETTESLIEKGLIKKIV